MSSETLWVSLWVLCQYGVLKRCQLSFPAFSFVWSSLLWQGPHYQLSRSAHFFICYNLPAIKVIWFYKEIQTNCLVIPFLLCFLSIHFPLQTRFSKGHWISLHGQSGTTQLTVDQDRGSTVMNTAACTLLSPHSTDLQNSHKPTAAPCQIGGGSYTVFVTFRFLSWLLLSRRRAGDSL